MEYCMEAKALKASLRRELTQQALIEEFWVATGISGVPTEDFSVDDLLDLSNGEFEDGSVEEEEEKDSISVDDENSNSSNLVSADSESSLASQLLVPDDNLAELEWVSHFVDDSISELSLLHPVGARKPEARALNRAEPDPKPARSRAWWYPSQVPVKPRTNRVRPASRVWSSTSSISQSSSSSSSSCGFSFSTPCLVSNNHVQSMDMFAGEPAAKKQKKRPAVQTGFGDSVWSQFQRRCSHCHVQKTPQWRTGPLGPKTLCNACGVRFKSGRLFPEYRPACSPTFSGEVHSNSHRKVLEMRRRKEVSTPEPDVNRMIPSF